MKWLISFFSTFIGGFIVSIIKFFVKRFGFASVAFAIQITFNTLILAVFMAFLLFTTNYIIHFWNMLFSLVHSYNTFGSGVSGQAFGISLSTIVSNFWGFMYASGLSEAFLTVGNAFMAVLSLVFIRALWNIYLILYRLLFKLLNSGLNLLSHSISL